MAQRPRTATVHLFGGIPGVFRPGDWQSTAWAVDPTSRLLHIAVHDYEGDSLALSTIGYFFPGPEPAFGPPKARLLPNAESCGASPNEPPPMQRVVGLPAATLDPPPLWATPVGGLARYLLLALHREVVPRDQLYTLLANEKGRLARAFDALRGLASRRGIVAGIKGDQIAIDCPPGTSYRDMDAHWRWLRDEGSAQAGFTRTEFHEYVCIMQVIDTLPTVVRP